MCGSDEKSIPIGTLQPVILHASSGTHLYVSFREVYSIPYPTSLFDLNKRCETENEKILYLILVLTNSSI